jgi:hypothetical protein
MKRSSLLVVTLVPILAAGACGPRITPTIFVAPTMAATPPPIAPSASSPNASLGTELTIIPTVVIPSPTPPCVDGLSYLQDLTIPDGSRIAPGQAVDKQWQVSNSGTCNWDDRYRLKLLGGDAMGAEPQQPLYPARAGTEATIRILFTAPATEGIYQCQWQAIDPDGLPFGDAFYMEIFVTP